MLWFFQLLVLLSGGHSSMVVMEVGPFASQEQCIVVQKTLYVASVKQGDTYYGWTKSNCVSRAP